MPEAGVPTRMVSPRLRDYGTGKRLPLEDTPKYLGSTGVGEHARTTSGRQTDSNVFHNF